MYGFSLSRSTWQAFWNVDEHVYTYVHSCGLRTRFEYAFTINTTDHDGHSIEVGAAACGGGGSVGHGDRRRFADVNETRRDLERASRHLNHLRVKTLSHLGATVRQQHRPVRVDVYKSASLRFAQNQRKY